MCVSNNVAAEVRGTGRPGEWLTVGAHYDSTPLSCGMYDNASGSAIIMEACRYYTAHPPLRSLRFIWFGAEERGLLGSRHHVGANSEELNDTLLMLNVDLAGQPIGAHHMVVAAEKSVCELMSFFAKEAGVEVAVRHGIFSSDSEVYADAGIPAVSFYRQGTGGGHTRYDTIDLISARSLEQSARFFIHFSGRLANSEYFPVTRNVPDVIKEKLDVYMGRKDAKTES
jgi:Zn-dependent M28 family amino/carboxypeptidase